MGKPVNLKRAVERKGIKALNIIVRFGKVIKFELYGSIDIARNNCREGYTYTVEQAVAKFPMYFSYK